MLPTLIIEASDGTEKATLDCTTAEATFARRQMDRATATVAEDAYAAVDINPISDRLFIDRPDGTRLFGGRFDDDQRDGATITVTIASFRRDAIDAEPTGRSLTFSNVADTTVVQNAINNVPTLTAGTLNELASALSFELPNSSRAKQIRKAAVATGAAVRYNPDRTIDYVDQLGSDRTLTLSPSNRNLVGDVRVEEDVRDRVTHVRAFGSRELGLTADGVTDSYAGGRQVWREFEDTDIRSQDRLQQIADRLAAEYDGDPRKLTVEATVIGEELQRGDRVTVHLPDRDIDRMMTVTRLIERFGQRGRELVATLTNRLVDADAQPSGRESLQRFNRGYQGFVDRNQVTSGWNVAGDGTPQTLEIVAYPDDIVSEERVELVVQGRPWRSPVDIQSHSHDVPVSITAADNTEFSNTVVAKEEKGLLSVSTSVWTDADTITPTVDTALLFAHVRVIGTEGNRVLARYYNTSENEFIPSASGWAIPVFAQKDSGSVEFKDGRNVNGDTLKLQLKAANSDTRVLARMLWQAQGRHTHDVSSTETTDTTVPATPTVVSSFDGTAYYPADVEIRVNGSLITTISGDSAADWQTTVDLSGELTAGQNAISATPTGQRGSLNLTLATELFRRGP